ncbi:MAG: hypothetical protein EBV68_00480 [Betaproteobacteria bacterium]|nr:hypothetical protein [Betaproteobacteria bacterium]
MPSSPLGIDDVYPEDPDDEFDLVDDWKERIDSLAPGTESFSLEAGEATTPIQIPWNKARDALRKILGFDYADKAAPWALHRENPTYHGRFPWLTAANCTFQGVEPSYNDSQGGFLVEGLFDNPPSPYVAKYSTIFGTVRFRDVPWEIRPDSSTPTAADEIKRNVYFDCDPSIEVLSAEGASFLKFIEGTPAADPATSSVPAPLGTLLAKTNFILNWMRVPHDYISDDPNILNPVKILACVGRVNSAAFGPFTRPGTLLMMPPKFERFRYPVCTVDGISNFFGWNVRIPLQYFNPDKGVANTPPGTSPYYGHNLMPYRADLKWYMAIRGPGTTVTTDNTFLPQADFNDIFRHARS